MEQAVQKKLEGVPEERLKSPDPEIAVPLIQSLTCSVMPKPNTVIILSWICAPCGGCG